MRDMVLAREEDWRQIEGVGKKIAADAVAAMVKGIR